MLILFRQQNYLVNNFTIYGERHSGTNLLEKTAIDSLGLAVTWEFGWKHFFGFADYKKIAKSKNTLFFAIARNPYDWIAAMHKKQYHIPINNQQPIENFISNEWYSIDDYGKEIREDRHYILGRRYKNIFEMRKNKLQYMINYMPTLCNNLCITTYEHIIKHPASFVKIVSKTFDVKASIDDIPLVWNKKNYNIPKNIKSIIDSNIDWELEDYFGYSVSK